MSAQETHPRITTHTHPHTHTQGSAHSHTPAFTNTPHVQLPLTPAKTAASVSAVPTNDHLGVHTHPVSLPCPSATTQPCGVGNIVTTMPPTNPKAEEEIRAQNGEWLA